MSDDTQGAARDVAMARVRNKLGMLANLAVDVRDAVGDRMAGGSLLDVGPIVAEKDIAAFEVRLGHQLPASYRSFLSGIGDGPFGPGFEMRSVGSSTDSFSMGPRVYRPEDYCTFDEDDRQAPLFRAALDDLRSACNDNEVHALELSTYGCGMSAVLVLDGPARGEVWLDDPNMDIVGAWGYFDAMFHSPGLDGPYVFGAERFDMLAWYESWLDCLLAVADEQLGVNGFTK